MPTNNKPRKTTADSVSAARKLDHLMLLMTAQLTTPSTKPTASMIKKATESRDKIYELIDDGNELKFERVANPKLFNRLTGKGVDRKAMK